MARVVDRVRDRSSVRVSVGARTGVQVRLSASGVSTVDWLPKGLRRRAP